MSIEQIKKGNDLSQSLDIINENIAKLKELFPEVMTEGKIDFTVLQDILGEEIETGEEFYRFTWAGKTQARREAHKPSTGTLRPCKLDSVNWDTTENLYIEGDNLEVLKLLQKSYSNKVKMIYIDPPYNTGNDFVYKDNYKDNLRNYQELTGQIDADGNRLSTNSDSDGRYHSNWCNMIYPRLKLARTLLKDDGVIFISIDDNEVENLRKIGNEIFGEENLVANVPRIAKRTSDKGTFFRPTKDYILVYSKSISELQEFGIQKKINEKDYNLSEIDGRKYKQSGASLYQPSLDSRPNQRYYIEAPDGSLIIPPGDTFPDLKKDGSKVKPLSNNDKVWRWSVDSYLKQKHLLIFTKGSSKNPLLDENGKQSNWNIYPKVFLDEDINSTLHPEDVIYDYPNSQGTKEINELEIPFSFSKPTNLICYLLKLTTNFNDLILDFFSGSATTAHAVMQLNAIDDGNRKHIMVQLPEPTDEKSEAYTAGYKSISEIGKERIRRAGKKILAELQNSIDTKAIKIDNLRLQNILDNSFFEEIAELEGEIETIKQRIATLDTGFKVFKLDSSNIKAWDGNPAELEASLFDSQDNIKTERTEEDVLYEILLKYGLDLTLPITEKTIAKKRVFSIGAGALFICLANDITKDVAEGIGAWKQELNPEVCRVVFKDTGFNDVEKANSVQILKRFGINEIKSI
jgi:adenine-specific DNA-methyltransferase